jgi:hypothetical protein
MVIAVRTEISSLQFMRSLQNDGYDRDTQRVVERQGYTTAFGHTYCEQVSMIYSARNELHESFHVP